MREISPRPVRPPPLGPEARQPTTRPSETARRASPSSARVGRLPAQEARRDPGRRSGIGRPAVFLAGTKGATPAPPKP